MNAIVTVVGKDQVGIIAGVCNTLADHNINVLDISQTIMEGFFTMMMVVDLALCTESFRICKMFSRPSARGAAFPSAFSARIFSTRCTSCEVPPC